MLGVPKPSGQSHLVQQFWSAKIALAIMPKPPCTTMCYAHVAQATICHANIAQAQRFVMPMFLA